MKTFLSGCQSYLGWKATCGNYIYHCYSCLDSSSLWTLNFTMYYELCNPKVGVVLPNWRSESQGAIYPYEWCSYYELRASRGGNEGRNRTGSILKAGLHLGSDCGLWAVCPLSMETTYQLKNQAPWMEEPQGSPSPKRILYLCNRIESYIPLCFIGMTTSLLIIVHCNYLGLRHMNYGLTLIVSFFFLCAD